MLALQTMIFPEMLVCKNCIKECVILFCPLHLAICFICHKFTTIFQICLLLYQKYEYRLFLSRKGFDELKYQGIQKQYANQNIILGVTVVKDLLMFEKVLVEISTGTKKLQQIASSLTLVYSDKEVVLVDTLIAQDANQELFGSRIFI